LNIKGMLGKKKEKEEELDDNDVLLFNVEGQEEPTPDTLEATGKVVQTVAVKPESAPEEPRKKPLIQMQPVESVEKEEEPTVMVQEINPESGVVDKQLQELSSNLKNLVYDFRSFMSEAGSPFNPNEIPVTPAADSQFQRAEPLSFPGEKEGRGPGYISAQNVGAEEKEALESPSDIQSKFAEKYLKSKLEETERPSLSAASKLKDTLKAIPRGTRFSANLKSNLDSVDMPALIRAVNSTDYLLHVVGRQNLLKILEVGTREGWIKPEVERLVLSVAEVLSSSGVATEERSINVSDLLRVVYFLNRLLDPEISDFLSMNSIQEKQYIVSRNAQH
jgi:archaellum component FlaD/FlaE